MIEQELNPPICIYWYIESSDKKLRNRIIPPEIVDEFKAKFDSREFISSDEIDKFLKENGNVTGTRN